MYGISRFADKLNILKYINSTRNREIEYLEIYKFNKKIRTLYVRNVWICG